MGYPNDLLTSRSIIKHGGFALIPPEGLVNNVVPGFENCIISILASPKLGASFVDYIITMSEGGRTTKGFGGNGIETFVYCIEGKIKVTIKNEDYIIESGGYVYCTPTETMNLENIHGNNSKIFLYKQKYQSLEGYEPWVVVSNIKEQGEVDYDNMANVKIIDFLPKDLAFDMNFHILTFYPGACHPFIETHVQEHGAYLLSGEGLYNLDNTWIPVKKNDYIWFGPYVPQCCYGVGRENLSYIYSKDCNRDVIL
ncbi:(S)-ureidoglycine aminohydrolase [Terrisporobacter mayombei]|uniref:(S)-ureidoglycine aminohydrolase n=1 Tax=Terrisporobacter mayombei TaxID=1541 RepID=A0ABY9PZ80_9FIRM|nr:(S)-ureidoglycine aminohydrolase [Terrisporobacter mayombei]MCC3868200.1 (S)-ureidoglycine aminohydrolase [Terrisporobacter mayombei]WMT80340.1 (S)-ureidoglycine aminohydrolase [Terrisporobacter mayombei]